MRSQANGCASTVSAVDAEKQPWSNEQVFHADEHGVVDVADIVS